jgi:hypothetical protein
VNTCDPVTYQGKRDRALLLLGFAGALRRSELVALDVAHLRLSDEGFVVTIVRSKTDQEGERQKIAIPRVPDSPYCPVRAVIDWMAMAGIEQDALFRRVTKGNKLTADRLTDQSVARIGKTGYRPECPDSNYTRRRRREIPHAKCHSGLAPSRADRSPVCWKRYTPRPHSSSSNMLSPVFTTIRGFASSIASLSKMPAASSKSVRMSCL